MKIKTWQRTHAGAVAELSVRSAGGIYSGLSACENGAPAFLGGLAHSGGLAAAAGGGAPEPEPELELLIIVEGIMSVLICTTDRL